jgi:hypothetical protein
MLKTAVGMAVLPGLIGLVGCSEQGTLPPTSKEAGAKSRDERQKAREFGTVNKDGVAGPPALEKAVPAKGRPR